MRRAQKDYQFAGIYEKRATNKILVSGFGNLASAIGSIGDRITAALEDLSDTITVSISDQNEVIANQSKLIEQGFSNVNEALETSNADRRKHDKAAEEMLDNIQSKRKPIRVVPNPRDGDWEQN